MKGHDHIADELLARIDGDYGSTTEDRQRVREKLRARLAAAGAPATTSARASSAGPSRAGMARHLGKIAAVSAIVALGTIAYRASRLESNRASASDAPAVVAVMAPTPSASASATETPAIAVESLPSAIATGSAKARTHRSSRAPSAPAKEVVEPQTAPDDDLSEETRILGEANRAARENAFDRGLGFLDEHARRFPHGVLADERAVVKITMLCQAGRRVEARAQATRFLANRTASPLTRRVEASCGGEP